MPFPSTSLIDSFTRANEDPIAGSWAGPTRLPAVSGVLKIASNELAASSIVASTAHSYFNTSFGADQEGWLTVTTLPAAAGGVSITARIDSPNSVNDDFYQWTYTTGTGWRMFAVINDGYGQLGSTVATPALAAGEKIGFELFGSTLRGMHFTAGSWKEIMSVTDTQITAGGFIGVEITDLVARVDDFGGGTRVLDSAGAQYNWARPAGGMWQGPGHLMFRNSSNLTMFASNTKLAVPGPPPNRIFVSREAQRRASRW